ncbi:MAG: prephenate dehydratase [Planctomycetaceae bacterium]
MAKKKLSKNRNGKATRVKPKPPAARRAATKASRAKVPTTVKKKKPVARALAAPSPSHANRIPAKQAVSTPPQDAAKAVRSAPKPKAPPSLETEVKTLDREILKLINRRAEVTTALIEGREKPHAALFDPRGDDELWQQLEEANPGPLSAAAVRGVFREVISAARRRVKTQRVAYLGPPFSFTHLAAIERFGEWADLSPVSTIAAVFEEVNRGHANYGLVPIENSTDGRVVDTLDMFTRLPLRICGEVQISVHHNLLARCPRGEITEIYSKPQALSQCRDWLARSMPQARLIEVTSTSTAAQLARDKPGAAAVASRQAAVEYDLQIIANDIEDNSNNVTRFAVIGDDVNSPTGKDRTAVLLQIPHRPGSLSDALTGFKRNKINLTWIESFPLRGPETGYLFFIDFEGHSSEPAVKRTLEDLKKNAVRMEVLGSYPRSEAFR